MRAGPRRPGSPAGRRSKKNKPRPEARQAFSYLPVRTVVLQKCPWQPDERREPVSAWREPLQGGSTSFILGVGLPRQGEAMPSPSRVIQSNARGSCSPDTLPPSPSSASVSYKVAKLYCRRSNFFEIRPKTKVAFLSLRNDSVRLLPWLATWPAGRKLFSKRLRRPASSALVLQSNFTAHGDA